MEQEEQLEKMYLKGGVVTWDEYYLKICQTVGSNSKCHSRQIGAILVKDNRIISTGYNGPPVGVPECRERYKIDKSLLKFLRSKNVSGDEIKRAYNDKVCPRRPMKFPSGEGLEWCCAIHAEKNCLLSAALQGISTKGATMYANMDISPCSQCLGACINAGIKELVLLKNTTYDATVEWVNYFSSIKIREFNLKEDNHFCKTKNCDDRGDWFCDPSCERFTKNV